MKTPEPIEYYATLPMPDPPRASSAPSPVNPAWQSWEAIGVWIASVLFIVFVPMVFLLPYIAMNGVSLADSHAVVEFAKTDTMSIVVQVLAIIPAHLLTVALAWLVVTRAKRYSFTEMLGWRSGGFAWWHYVVVLVGFGLIAVAVDSVIPEQENDLIRMLRSSRLVLYVVAFVAVSTAPFVEELVYRGVLYSAFQRAMGVPLAFALVTFLFALVHVPQYWPSASTIMLLTLLSVILTAIRVKTGNLLPCVIFHTLFNALQSLLLILQPQTLETGVPDPTSTIMHLLR